ncbi:MAG: primary-amine oxidase [Actinomycetes bacterium]
MSSAHPLDPFSHDELEHIVAHSLAAWDLDHRHLFAMVQLEEPAKADILAFKSGDSFERAARVTVLDRSTTLVHEGVITTTGLVRSWRVIEGAKSPVLSTESDQAIAAAKADPRVIAALKKRGVTDVDLVLMETWPIGAQIPQYLDDGRRLVWTPMWWRPDPEANPYAHPINGVYAIIDLQTCEVVGLEDDNVTAIPQTRGDYRLSQTGGNVELKSLDIVQKDGPSFSVDGWKIDWERWSLRVGWDQREGLVIHDVRFNDNGNVRRIGHRMSIAELVIPYGDPSQGTYRKNAFDTGEYGLGNYTNSLTLGCDCLGEIVYLDVALANPEGVVRTIKNAICMHEEDFGILWKHVDMDGHVEVRRGRRFVVSSIVTINNYEYGYYWYFYQDGAIEFEAKLTGILLTLSDEPGVAHPSATQIEEGLWAPYHQHTFCARLDLDIDGTENSVIEVDSVAREMGPENPHGGAYVTTNDVIAKESAASRLLDLGKSRYWKIVNPNKKNHVGQPVGYKILGNVNCLPLASPDSVIGKRAGFMYKHLWVTQNTAQERYPAGDYPFQHEGGDGLPRWIKQDRSLENTDVVMWYVFGLNHIPRIEDWPVMPVERLGFTLKPVGFFRRSPAIAVAPNEAKCHCNGVSCNCGPGCGCK